MFVDYSVDKNGKYELTLVANDPKSKLTVADIATNKGITSNTALFDGTNVANANTIFLVKKGTGSSATYTAYKGIANVPGVAQKDLTDGQVVSKNGVATYVYIEANKFTGDVSAAKYAYILNKNAYEVVSDGNNGQNYVFEAIVDGVKTTLTVADESYIVANGLVTYVTVDGVVNEAVKPVEDFKNGITAISGGTMVAGGTAYLYTDDTVFYAIDEKAGTVDSVTADSISVSEKVKVFVINAEKTENNTASVVFVITPAEG